MHRGFEACTPIARRVRQGVVEIESLEKVNPTVIAVVQADAPSTAIRLPSVEIESFRSAYDWCLPEHGSAIIQTT
jgi:hypothetical protein